MKNINPYQMTKSRFRAALAIALAVVPVIALSGIVQAATLTTASVSLSDSRPGTLTVKYDFLASNVTTATALKCVKLQFTANSDGTGGVPTGFDSSVAAVAVNAAQSDFFSNHTGWALNKATNGTLLYTNAGSSTAPSLNTGANFVVDGITNGNQVDDDKYVTLSTYTAADCTTGPIDSSTVGFLYTTGQQVTISVDGSLSFSIAGVAGNGALAVNSATITNGLTTTATTIPFATLTSSTNRIAAQDLTVSTNSGLGYTVSTRYTGTPTAGSYSISDLATHTNAAPGSFSAAGTEGFGYTTEDGSLGTGTPGRFTATGGNKWAPFTTTNAEVAYNNAPVANQTTRVGLQAGISGSTEPGAYTTTVIYTATPVY